LARQTPPRGRREQRAAGAPGGGTVDCLGDDQVQRYAGALRGLSAAFDEGGLSPSARHEDLIVPRSYGRIAGEVAFRLMGAADF